MTLPALDSWIARGTTGPKYKVGPRCANPHCHRFAEHAHHILRRSFLAGAYDWVEIDNWVVGNLTGLCPACHSDVTGSIGGHKAAIRIDIEKREFWWCQVRFDSNGAVEYLESGLLDPQPPTPTAAEQGSDQAEESDSCPTCGHVRRRRSSNPNERRRRKSWLVRVPDDEMENGADVLDALVENLAPYCPSGDSSTSGRYYVIVAALAHAAMDIEAFQRSVKGVG